MRILSHNVFWFQGHPFAGDQPGEPNPHILAECLALYRHINPDILCLQEIQSPATAAALAAALHRPVLYLPGNELPQYGACILGENITLEPPPPNASPLPPHRVWQRARYTAPAGEKTAPATFTLANVHAPSDRQLGAASASRRQAEFAARFAEPPRPDVLCGDFNERPGRPVHQFLRGENYSDTAEATHNGDRSTSIGGKRSDFIWLAPALAPQLKAYDVIKVHNFLSRTSGREFISDHLPLWIDLA